MDTNETTLVTIASIATFAAAGEACTAANHYHTVYTAHLLRMAIWSRLEGRLAQAREYLELAKVEHAGACVRHGIVGEALAALASPAP